MNCAPLQRDRYRMADLHQDFTQQFASLALSVKTNPPLENQCALVLLLKKVLRWESADPSNAFTSENQALTMTRISER